VTELECGALGSDAAPSNPVNVALPPAADTQGEPAPPTGAPSPQATPREPLFVNGARLHSSDGTVYVASHVTRHTLTLTRADTGAPRDRQEKRRQKRERRRLRAERQVVVDHIDAAVAAGERPQVDW
jgi:hypothetical protein